MLGTLTGYTALDLLPSVAVACLVIAAVHLAFLMIRYAANETAPAGHSPRDQAPVAPTTTAAPVIEPQATLDSATSLERRSLVSSPPSASCPKDLEFPPSVKRASDSAALSDTQIITPRVPPTSAADNHHIGATDDIRNVTDAVGPSRESLATGLGQLQQRQQLPVVRKELSSGNGGLYRPGSDPARFAPSSPGNVTQNAYLVSISDDYVAPLSTLRDSPATADSQLDRTAAGQRKLQPLPPVPSASEEGSSGISRSSSGTSAQGRQQVANAPAARSSTAAWAATGTSQGSPPPSAPSTQPKARLDLAVVRQQLQRQHGRDVEGRCVCMQHHSAPSGGSAGCKLEVLAAAPATARQAPRSAAAAVPAPVVHIPDATSSVAPHRPSALYTSPMQHITVSVKVPNPYAPATAHSLQNIVAQHVISAAAEQQPPQHTIMHMVSVPGCIQLLMSIVNWQLEQQPPAAEASDSAGASAEASTPSAVTPASPGLRDSVQSLTANLSTGANFVSNSVIAAPADAVATGPAPSWMVQAVCSAVQEFMCTHAADLTEAHDANSTDASLSEEAAAASKHCSVSVGSGTPGTMPLQTDDKEHQHQSIIKHTPVLIDINGQQLMMTPGPAGPAGTWRVHELDTAQEASSCGSPHADWTAAVAAHSAVQDPGVPTAHVTASSPEAAAAAGIDEPAAAAADGRCPLPEGVWAWPLCLPIVDTGSDNSSGSSSVAQPVTQPLPASAAGAVIAVHGLPGESVRLVITDPGADVMADCTCQLANGVARITPIASNSISRYTIYCISQPDAFAAASTAPATQDAAVRFALPLLCLPHQVVSELHEAAREIMLEQSRARWLQLQDDPGAVTDAAECCHYYMSDLASDDGGGRSASAAEPGQGTAAADTPSVMFHAGNSSSSSNGSCGGGNRHVGSFTTQRPQSRHAQAGRESLFEGLSGSFEQQLHHHRQQQQQHQLSGRPQQQVSGSGNGTDSSSSRLTFEEEDAEHYVHLRGRLFDGADVHQLLQQQFLAVMSDIGLLMDLAAAAMQGTSAGAAAAGATAAGACANTTAIAVSIGVNDDSTGRGLERLAAAVEPEEVTRIMATAVGQQLLTWAGGLKCWSCCQWVLSLLADIGVVLVMQDVIVGREHIATAADVQALLLDTRPLDTAAGAATAADDPALPAVAVNNSLPETSTAATQLLPQQNALPEVQAVPVTGKEHAAEQHRLHTLLEGRLSGVGSSESPIQWWGDGTHSVNRGKTAADSSRARDQVRAAAAAAIAGNMPGSAALRHKRSSSRAPSGTGGSAAASVVTTPATVSSAASGPMGMSAATTGTTQGVASRCGSASSVPVTTFPSVGPTSQAAAAATAVTSHAATAAFDAATGYTDFNAQQQVKTRHHQRMSIKDSASEMISRLMRRKSSSAGHRERRTALDAEFGDAAATE